MYLEEKTVIWYIFVRKKGKSANAFFEKLTEGEVELHDYGNFEKGRSASVGAAQERRRDHDRARGYYPAAGTDHSAVRLAISEREECCGNPEWVDICKMPE